MSPIYQVFALILELLFIFAACYASYKVGYYEGKSQEKDRSLKEFKEWAKKASDYVSKE